MSKKKKKAEYLFFGGPLDGKFIDVSAQRRTYSYEDGSNVWHYYRMVSDADKNRHYQYDSETSALTASLTRKEVISIQPGDLIVVTMVQDCTPDLLAKIGDGLKDRFPSAGVHVLAGGNKLEVYREQEKV